MGVGVAEAGLRRCLEGVQLVGLPVRGGKDQAARMEVSTADAGGEEDWDAWGGGDEAASAPPKESNADEKKELGLWEVERRLFADNQAARDVLDDLDIEILTETEARSILRKRVELDG